MQTLDIILPCYNPIEGWVDSILESVVNIGERLPEVELFIFLVNDGSSKVIPQEEISRLEAELPHFQYIHYTENGGKGFALREGIKKSTHDLCIFTDVDFPYTEASFVRLYHKLSQENVEVAVGTRSENYYDNVPSVRVKISKLFKFFVRKFFRLPVTDTQCGLKGMKISGKKIFLQTKTNRYLFDLEFIHLAAHEFPEKIHPVEVELKPNIVFSSMNFKILLQEGWSFLIIFFGNFFRRN